MHLFKRQDFPRPLPIDAERREELSLFQRLSGIRFRNLDLLNLAFAHRSFANERAAVANNERLEFLGDSVLGLAISEYLYGTLPDRVEGELARIKSFVVSEAILAEAASRIRVDNFILIGKGEEFSGGRTKKTLLADALEAIIGAYFLDSGFKEARRFVLRLLAGEIDKVIEDRHQKDYKTLLQEMAQRVYHAYPKYVMTRRTGPDHDRVFWMDVQLGGSTYGPGCGTNKKAAEQAAAKIAYERLQEESASRRHR